MSEEEIKQLTKVSMQKTIKENLHSEMIFVYVDNLEQENKQLKEKLNTYENPDDMTLMFMWCDEKAKDKIKELTQVLLDIKEYIKEKRKSGEIFYINEVEKMINKALGDKENEQD